MGRMKEHPRYNVISIRVTDEEWETLRRTARLNDKKISQVVREMLCHLEPPGSGGIC